MVNTMFWGVVTAFFGVIFSIAFEGYSASLLISGGAATLFSLAELEFYQICGIFLGVFAFLIIAQIITKLASKITKRRQNNRLRRRFGYVCRTVYPDIPGKVLVGGNIYKALSDRTIYHGEIVLCSKPENGELFVSKKK